jgi:hypothetical protein
MQNTLSDLNNYLFETLERLLDDDLTDEQMQREITRSQAVTSVAETVIHNGELALKTMQHLNDMGYGSGKKDSLLAPVPKMLEVSTG